MGPKKLQKALVPHFLCCKAKPIVKKRVPKRLQEIHKCKLVMYYKYYELKDRKTLTLLPYRTFALYHKDELTRSVNYVKPPRHSPIYMYFPTSGRAGNYLIVISPPHSPTS